MTPYPRFTPLLYKFKLHLGGVIVFLGISILTGCATPKISPPKVQSTRGADLPNDPVLTDALAEKKTIPSLIPIGPLQSITPKQVGGLRILSTEPPKELWDRIRRGFTMPDLQSDLVTDREQWYATRPDYIGRMTER